MHLDAQLKKQMDRIEVIDHDLSMKGVVRYYHGEPISFEDKNGREIKEGEWVLANNRQRLGLVRYFQKRAEYKVIFANGISPLYTLGGIEVVDVEL